MISVAMPYWNRPKELARSMLAYEKLYPDLELEFSICDDGSFQPLQSHGKPWKITRLPFHAQAMNPCVPINAAIRAATHDVIVLTNPEVEHYVPVLHQMLSALQEPDDYVMAACHDPELGVVAGEGTPYGAGGRGPIPKGADLHFCTMFYRNLWEKAGGFDEEYRNGTAWDDNDWLWRLHVAGANFKRISGVVRHYRTPHRWTQRVNNQALFMKKWAAYMEKHDAA